MKTSTRLTLSLAAIGAAAIVIYVARQISAQKMLVKVADEGYETAHDILYPNKNNSSNRMRYGPVLPM